jgi:hypothetical protein
MNKFITHIKKIMPRWKASNERKKKGRQTKEKKNVYFDHWIGTAVNTGINVLKFLTGKQVLLEYLHVYFYPLLKKQKHILFNKRLKAKHTIRNAFKSLCMLMHTWWNILDIHSCTWKYCTFVTSITRKKNPKQTKDEIPALKNPILNLAIFFCSSIHLHRKAQILF